MVWLLLFCFAGQFEDTFRAGLVALNRNDLAAAQSSLEEASRLQPRNGRVWLALAQTYWKLRELPQAQQAAQSAGEFGQGDAVVTQALAGFYSEAYYFETAQFYLKQQNFAAALDLLDAGRKKFARSAQLELAAGVAFYGLRRFSEAIDAFLGTIRLDPTVEQPYAFLGRVLDQAEDRLPKITAVFAAFAKRAPDNYLSTFLYGKALALTDDPNRAADLFRQSIARNDTYWESHFELGVLLARQDKLEDAAAELRRAIDLNPQEPVPHYHLARLYDRMGKTADAAAERALHARLTAAGQPMGGIK